MVGNSIFFLSFLMQCFDLVLCCKEEPIQWYRFLRVQQLRRSGRLDHRISSICPNSHPIFQQLLPLDGLFGVLNALNAALICRGFKNASRGSLSSSLFRKGIFELGGCVARALVPSIQGGHCVAASHSHMRLLSRGAGEHLPMWHVFVMILMPKRHARDAFAPHNGVQ